MKCRKCHAEIQDNSRFCLLCGVKQEKERKSHRGNKQGTAIKRGNTWTAVWTESRYLDEDGKLHYKRRWKGGFKNKTEALAFAAHPLQEEKSSPTLRYYYNGWSKTDMQDLSQSKKTAFEIAWNKLGSIVDIDIDKLTIQDLQACVDAKAPTYYTAKDMRTLLSHLYKRAVAEGTARTNLSSFIRLPELKEKEMQPFTEDEILSLWDAYKTTPFVGYILLMIYSGMMPGELLKLKSDMVNWEERKIIGCGLKTTKRKETPIFFPDIITPVLQNLIANSSSRQGYVLGMNKDNFYKTYHSTLQSIGIRDLPPYSCRHTTATALVLSKVHPSVIKEVMRHTKFTTTQRYIHPDDTSARDAVDTIVKPKSDIAI